MFPEFREREEERENIGWLPCIRGLTGIKPATQVRTLPGDRAHGMTLQPTEPPQQTFTLY